MPKITIKLDYGWFPDVEFISEMVHDYPGYEGHIELFFISNVHSATHMQFMEVVTALIILKFPKLRTLSINEAYEDKKAVINSFTLDKIV